jgi:hypothetical protein
MRAVRRGAVKHDPEKCEAVFRKGLSPDLIRGSCSNKKLKRDDDFNQISSRFRDRYARLASAVSGAERLTISRSAKLDWMRATFGRRESCVLWMCS